MTKKHPVRKVVRRTVPKRRTAPRRKVSPSPMKSTTKMVTDVVGFSATAMTGMAGIGMIKAMLP